jgi:transcriptional regulator with PAS, ATPase and Fis domain
MSSFEAFVEGETGLSFDLAHHLTNTVTVLCRNDGSILDCMESLHYDSYENCIPFIASRVRSVKNIFDLFERNPLATFTEKEDSVKDQTLLPVKRGMIPFSKTQNEFHSLIPLVLLRRFFISNDRFIGLIRLSNFFTNIFEEAASYPMCCTNGLGKVIGVNEIFRNLTGYPIQKLMEKTISDLLTTHPEQIQKDLINASEIEHNTKLHSEILLTESKLTKKYWSKCTDGKVLLLCDNYKFYSIDFEIELTVEKGSRHIPCIIVGDIGNNNPEYTPDNDGYLVGPVHDGAKIALKKKGMPLYVNYNQLKDFCHGRFNISKKRNVFTFRRENKILLQFADLDSIDRKENASLMLFLRSNEKCILRSVRLSLYETVKEQREYNVLTAFKNKKKNYYQINVVDSWMGPSPERSRTVYRLRDMTSFKKEIDNLQQEFEDLQKRERSAALELARYKDDEGTFIASCKQMISVKSKAERLANSSATILINGETGTGKEVLARYIHANSPFADGPFVKVDCSLLPATLMESLLFGHNKGAFTGADAAHKGLFESANNGTLFLDEINNVDLNIQSKLLQFLHDRKITPLGSSKSLHLNTRIVVASNENIKLLADKKLFRTDLYYRIAVGEIELPPVRDRKEDIPLLSTHYLFVYNHKYGKSIRGFSADAFRQMDNHEWPGNIRELKNCIERAVLYCESNEIGADDLLLPDAVTAKVNQTGKRSHKIYNKINLPIDEVRKLFKAKNGMVERVAEELGVTRQTVYNYLKKKNIQMETLHPE